MKVLYFGGQKSGKSSLAESKTLEISSSKAYYIATYDSSFQDSEMLQRIQKHKNQRKNSFITIEETTDIASIIKPNQTYLIDCMSMWILNTLDKPIESLLDMIDSISKIDANVVFVLNEVSSGVIPIDRQSRQFVDRSGIIGQALAKICDEVYEVKLGLGIKLK
jgi:adenosylcobinamide kinase/adenosylcobinamide-phosphate guanylyltransferase